jgi:hypothetical protein
MPAWGYEACLLYVMQVRNGLIAQELKQPLRVVNDLLHSDIGRMKIEQIRQERLETQREVVQGIQALAPRALEEMRRELESENEEARHRAARWILEAAGHTPLRKIEVRRRAAEEEELERLTLEELQKRALEAFKPKQIETTAKNVTPSEEGPVQ